MDSPKERKTFTSFADSRQAIGEVVVSETPSPSPSFQPRFTVWWKSQYGYITCTNMLQYKV